MFGELFILRNGILADRSLPSVALSPQHVSATVAASSGLSVLLRVL